MNRIVVVLLGALFIAVALIPGAGGAAASCDAVECLPNVARNVVEGAPCVPRPMYAFGLDAESSTLVCATTGVWQPTGRLVGLRSVALSCEEANDSAQDPNGIPLFCAQLTTTTLRWNNRTDTPAPPRCFSTALGCPFRVP